MKYHMHYYSILFLFITTNLAHAQQSRFQLDFQASSYLHNPVKNTALGLGFDFCGVLGCTEFMIRPQAIEARLLLQLNLNYIASNRLSLQAGVLRDQFRLRTRQGFEIGGLPFDEPTEQFLIFEDWMLTTQMNYHLTRWWDFGIGARLILGDIRNPFLEDTFFDLLGVNDDRWQPFFQNRFLLTISETLRLQAAIRVVNRKEWYFHNDFQWEGSFGLQYQL